MFFQILILCCTLAAAAAAMVSATVEIETISKPAACKEPVKEKKYAAIHYKRYFEDEPEKILDGTHKHDLPVEILVGSELISPALDEGLMGACLKEKRRITTTAAEAEVESEDPERRVVHEVELVGISSQPTMAMFNSLDEDGDDHISMGEAVKFFAIILNEVGLPEIPGMEPEELVKMLMQSQDSDTDRRLSRGEFKKFVNDVYPDKSGQFDKNEL